MGIGACCRPDPSIVTSSTQHIKAKFIFLERHSNQKEVTNEVTVAGGSHLHKDILLFQRKTIKK